MIQPLASFGWFSHQFPSRSQQPLVRSWVRHDGWLRGALEDLVNRQVNGHRLVESYPLVNLYIGCVWKCCVPQWPNGFADHYPVFKWLAIIGNIPYFQTNPHNYGKSRVSVGIPKLFLWPLSMLLCSKCSEGRMEMVVSKGSYIPWLYFRLINYTGSPWFAKIIGHRTVWRAMLLRNDSHHFNWGVAGYKQVSAAPSLLQQASRILVAFSYQLCCLA